VEGCPGFESRETNRKLRRWTSLKKGFYLGASKWGHSLPLNVISPSHASSGTTHLVEFTTLFFFARCVLPLPAAARLSRVFWSSHQRRHISRTSNPPEPRLSPANFKHSRPFLIRPTTRPNHREFETELCHFFFSFFFFHVSPVNVRIFSRYIFHWRTLDCTSIVPEPCAGRRCHDLGSRLVALRS
jgi:hypothetical protein